MIYKFIEQLFYQKRVIWSVETPKNYLEGSGCWEVVWKGIFMPFDVICGLDCCKPDNEDYDKYKKKYPLTQIWFANEHIRELALKSNGQDTDKGKFYYELKSQCAGVS